MAGPFGMGKKSHRSKSEKERMLPECYRSYRFVWIRSKGALVALLAYVLVPLDYFPLPNTTTREMAPFNYSPLPSSTTEPLTNLSGVYIAVISLAFPVLGLLTDVRLGRHKTLLALSVARFLLSAIPIPLVVLSILLRESSSQVFNSQIIYALLWLVNEPIAIWFAVVSFTFGLDQLLDSPSAELSVFIHWRCFGYGLAALFKRAVLFVISDPTLCDHVSRFLYFFAQIVCLLSLFGGRRLLNLQPRTNNPLKLICKVLKYATRNRVPRRRSAFTYWLEETPSRLDLGKQKFGGPFTEEEVEDVKTFFRLVPLIVVATTLGSLNNYSEFYKVPSHGESSSLGDFIADPWNTSDLIDLALFLVHLCLVFPLYHRHHPSMLRKIGIGCFACVTAFAFFLTIKAVDHVTTQHSIQYIVGIDNTTGTGVVNRIPTFRYMMYTPCFLKAMAGLFLTPLIEEFCFAQSPHNLKSLTFALILAWRSFFPIFLYLLPSLFFKCEGRYGSSGFYCYVSIFALALTFAIAYFIVAKRYRLRVRQEIYHAHYVVENIFEDEFDRRDQEQAESNDIHSVYSND